MNDIGDDNLDEKIRNREDFIQSSVIRAIKNLHLTAADEGVYNSYLISQLHLPKKISSVLVHCILSNSNYAFQNINVVETYTNTLVKFIKFAFQNKHINDADNIIPRVVESLGKIENLESIFIATSSYDADKPERQVTSLEEAKHAVSDIMVNMRKEEQSPAILKATSDVLINIANAFNKVPADQLSNIMHTIQIYFKNLRRFLKFLSLTESSEKLAVEFIKTINVYDLVNSSIDQEG